jgi:CMP-N,N'-diacetyllegionaminic acid synthase
MLDTIALIPARSGSKGVRDKNIKRLNNHPLIAYTIKAAHKVKAIQRVIVSTDSEPYAKIAKEYGAEVPFLRPPELSEDDSKDIEWIQHTLQWLKREEGTVPRLLIHLRPTTPLRDPEMVSKAIEAIEADKEATALRSVHEMPQSAYKSFQVQQNYLTCLCTGSMDLDAANLPRQQFPRTYQPNGYVDVLKTEFILNNNQMHGNKVRAYITPQIQEVDVPEDFLYLLYQINHYEEMFSRLFDIQKNS